MNKTTLHHQVTIDQVGAAAKRIESIALRTPLQCNARLSELYNAKVYLKREDLQHVRSYKIRGAYNAMAQLSPDQLQHGVVTASAGNHAQGVAYSAVHLRTQATIFVPTNTPRQKIDRVRALGGDWVTIRLSGDTFDPCSVLAQDYSHGHHLPFIHPFDDLDIITGQATIGKELYEELGGKLDVVLCPIGGGGLIAGVGSYLKQVSSLAEVFGVEPQGAASFAAAQAVGRPVELTNLDTFVDGAAVRQVGNLTFEITKNIVNQNATISTPQLCTTLIDLYQNEGIVAEPAGALAVSGLEQYKAQIEGKTVVCIVSGGNNDIHRTADIIEQSSQYRA